MNPKEMILTMLDHLDEGKHHVELKVCDQVGEFKDIELEIVYFHYTDSDTICDWLADNSLVHDDETGDTERCPQTECRWCKVGDVSTKAIVIEES